MEIKHYLGLGLSPAFKCGNEFALGFDIIYENSSQKDNFFVFQLQISNFLSTLSVLFLFFQELN